MASRTAEADDAAASARPLSWWLAAALAFPLAAAMLWLQQADAAAQLRLGDPDNYLRLVQVRDWISGQSWWDLVQRRIDPPAGLRLHWSRLADLPWALPIWLAQPLAGPAAAERLTLLLIPVLLLLPAMLALARTGDRLAGLRGAVAAAVLTLAAPPILAQFVPGRIDHHGLQLVLLAAALACAAGPPSLGRGLAAALLSAASLAIGLETAPYLALLAAWFAGRWVIRGGETREATAGFAAGLVLFVPIAFALTVPPELWAEPRADALGRGHVLAACLGGGLFAALVRDAGPRGRLIQVTIGGIGALAAALVFPEILRPPYGEVDPLLQRLWLGQLAETRSLGQQWAAAPLATVALFAFPSLAAVAGWMLATRARGADRDRLVLVSLLATAAWPLLAWQSRALPAATALAVPLAATALARTWARWQAGGSPLPFALALLVLNPVLPGAMLLAVSGDKNTAAPASATSSDPRCEAPANFAALNRLPPGLVLGGLDQSGSILARTAHQVVGAPLHRNDAANRLVFAVLTAPPDAAQAPARARGVDYLVVCLPAPETGNLAAAAPGGLLAALRAGRVPSWLRPVPGAADAGLIVFAVVK